KCDRSVSRCRCLQWPHSQRREASGPTGPGDHESRAVHQPEDREGSGPDDPAVGAGARGRTDPMISRRMFRASLATLALPAAAGGQTSGKVQRVGIIHLGGLYQVLVDGLRQGLRELGLEEGKQIVLDIRDTKGDLNAVGDAARDLEQRSVDLIYTVAT